MPHTDTERLDWLLGHSGADLDASSGRFYIRWFRESYWYIAYGESFRDCIDNALDGKIERV